MAVPRGVVSAAGSWSGKSKLFLPFLPEGEQVKESKSDLHVQLDPREAYAQVEYDWHYEGERQTGSILLCGDAKSGKAGAGWADSWHQNGTVMALSGEGMEGVVTLNGRYAVEGHPDWGWKITIEASESALSLRMDNVTPEGEATWAVEAVYERA
jgi:hypothetical protein